MRRRDFMKMLGGAVASWPSAARAQGSQRIARVSVLIGLDENDPLQKCRIRAFRMGLRDLGWIEGRKVEIEYRCTGVDADLIKRHVTEAVKLAPDVIVANTSPVTSAVRLATTTIPVVFAVV